ncbi:MAG: hypothetical protein AB8F78_14090 [Saprospiraceae bacterium]
MFQKNITRLAILLALAISYSMTSSFAQCDAEGGIISFTDGSNTKTIIVDGTPDPLDVVPDGTQEGTNAGWVITDLNLNILGLPAAPPFDLDGAGTGNCLIWHIRFEDGLMAAAVGNNASDLMGCYDLSNPLTVERRLATDVNGGNITFMGGATTESICVDGTPDPLDVSVDGTVNGESQAWVITDTQGNILGLPAAPPFDLDGAGAGTCLIWYLSFNGQITGAAVGNNAADLGGDYDLSNPITVQRNAVDGGGITFANGATTTTIIVDGTPDPLAVDRDGSATGSNSAWVITDTQGNILGLPAAPPFDLDGAGTGTCLIWYLRYEDGLTGAAVGNNASDLMGCFDLSNPLTVERRSPTDVNGGNIEFDGGTTLETICVDGNPDPLDVTVDASTVVGESQAWVITDTQGNILGLPAAPPFDLDGAGAGTCLIWYLSFNGQITGAAVGNNAANLGGDYDLSNPITVQRNAVDGGGITFDNGSTSTTIIVDGVPDPLNVDRDGTATGSNSAWVITDTQGNILGLPAAPPFDLDGAGVGTCLIWYLRYEDGLTGAAVGNNASDLMGCYDLSNPITVNRITGNTGSLATGTIQMPGGMTERYTCPGENIMITVELNYAVTTGDVAYFITDRDFNILGISPQPTVNLTGAPTGTCYIFAVNYTGNITVAVGDDFYDDDLTDGDDEASDNRIEVTRQNVEGGTILTQRGESEVYVCSGGDDFIGFRARGEEDKAEFVYVITDDSNNILGLNDQGYLNFGQVPAGTCRVWGLSYTGDITAQIGDNAAAVALTDGCFDLSDDFITVVRQTVDGGDLLSNGSERVSASASNPVVTYSNNSTSSAAYAHFILNRSQRIVAITFDQSFDFSTLGGESVYYIYGMSHNGNVLLSVGDRFWGRDVTDACFERSDNAVVVSYDASARPFNFTARPVGEGQLSLKLASPVEDMSDDRITLRITDAYGRVVFAEEGIDAANLENRVLELSNVVPGIHFISIQQNDVLVTERVVMP